MEWEKSFKYEVLQDELLRAIRTGEFRAGDRLPAERELAVRFQVTHTTVRRAVAELVEMELLERRSRLGIYVRDHSQEKLSTRTLNLICSVNDSSVTTEFLKYGTESATERGWRTRITRSYQGHEQPLLRVVRSREPSLISLDLPGLSPALIEAMVQSNGCAVMVGNRLDDPRIPSVMADDKWAMEMSIAHLRKAGHKNIALVVHTPDHIVTSAQIATWKECFESEVSAETLERRLIVLPMAEFQDGAETSFEAVSEYLNQPDADATAMICINDMLLCGAIFACEKHGLHVPDEMSFLCTADSFLMKHMLSGTTVIDICMQQHVKCAMDMIDSALEDDLPLDDRFQVVRPRLVSRNSVHRLTT